MKREQYFKEIENLKEVIKNAEKAKTELRDKYVEANQPFPKGTEVKFVLDSGRKAVGEVHKCGILSDGNVYVTAYKDSKDSKIKYISVPYQSVEEA